MRKAQRNILHEGTLRVDIVSLRTPTISDTNANLNGGIALRRSRAAGTRRGHVQHKFRNSFRRAKDVNWQYKLQVTRCNCTY